MAADSNSGTGGETNTRIPTMRLFTMETRSLGEDPPSKAFLACETGNFTVTDADFRSVLYFDLDNQGLSLKPRPAGDYEDVNGNTWDSGSQSERVNGTQNDRERFHGRPTPLHAQLLAKQVELQPVQYSETMTVSAIPNYTERYVSTWVDVDSKKRFNELVNFEPMLSPVNYATTVICYRNSTRRRHLSYVEYEPRVRPRTFSESMFIYPKTAETTYVSVMDYHIDECRRWFKSSVELKAKTYTTSRIQHEKPPTPRYSVTKTVTKQPRPDQSANGYVVEKLTNGPINGNNFDDNSTEGSEY